jgi:hypothetical protein
MHKHFSRLVLFLLVCAMPLALAAAPNKRHATCEEECQTSCHASLAGSRRQLVCEHECWSKCYSHRAEHK